MSLMTLAQDIVAGRVNGGTVAERIAVVLGQDDQRFDLTLRDGSELELRDLCFAVLGADSWPGGRLLELQRYDGDGYRSAQGPVRGWVFSDDSGVVILPGGWEVLTPTGRASMWTSLGGTGVWLPADEGVQFILFVDDDEAEGTEGGNA
ncbi:MAG TPA: hypothetical protein VFS33_05800 [Gemmatimonadales bacterium]|nr:hypothetical protein [Gemmatimonadales bacterium]